MKCYCAKGKISPSKAVLYIHLTIPHIILHIQTHILSFAPKFSEHQKSQTKEQASQNTQIMLHKNHCTLQAKFAHQSWQTAEAKYMSD